MAGGGSGANFTMHVKFIVEPLFMKRSGPPMISVIGSENEKERKIKFLLFIKYLA